MATLVGTGGIEGRAGCIPVRLAIVPLPPSQDGTRDAYHVTIGPTASGGTVDFQLCLRDWHFGHTDLRYLAYMFRDAEVLVACASVAAESATGAARPALCWDMGWASVALIHSGLRKRPDDLDVWVHLYDCGEHGSPSRSEGCSDRCVRFAMGTNTNDARRFGEELYAELVSAHDERQRLGLSTPDDEDWPDADSTNA